MEKSFNLGDENIRLDLAIARAPRIREIQEWNLLFEAIIEQNKQATNEMRLFDIMKTFKWDYREINEAIFHVRQSQYCSLSDIENFYRKVLIQYCKN